MLSNPLKNEQRGTGVKSNVVGSWPDFVEDCCLLPIKEINLGGCSLPKYRHQLHGRLGLPFTQYHITQNNEVIMPIFHGVLGRFLLLFSHRIIVGSSAALPVQG